MAELIVISEGRGKIHSHVIFFHGLNGDPIKTWQSSANPPECWPKWLAEDIEGLAVWSIGYKAASLRWFGTAMHLPDRAMNVFERILIEPKLKTGEIILIGHSLGGLLIKQLLRTTESIAIQRQDVAEFIERIRSISFMATPHFGADLAVWGDRLRILILPSAATACLVRNDPHLRDLNNWYRDWAKGRADITHLVLTETQRTIKFFFVVKPDSSDPGLTVRPIPIDADHISICKPNDRESDIYLHIRKFVDFNTPTTENDNAAKANIEWLTTGFSNKIRARNQFGQPLSPNDSASIKTLNRTNLINELRPYLTGPMDKNVVFVLGNEGCGKTWIVAQCWLALSHKPLMIILTPETFKESLAQNDINELLISKLIEQTADKPSEVKRKFWNVCLERWQRNPNVKFPQMIVFIDGINQKPSFDWGRIINKVGATLELIGGRLIISSRTHYYQDRIKNRLTLPGIEINVPEWMPVERNEIMKHYDINPATLHATVAQSLLNPRLLGIAIELFHKDCIEALEELSVSRLLFEHIRTSELDAPTQQPVSSFVRQLKEHAQKIIDRKQQKLEDDLNIFDIDTHAVADGRFFQPVKGEPEKYQLVDVGLTLALGFSVVDRLKTAKRNDHDLDVTLISLLEPISALDSTSDVVLAALTVTVDDDQYRPDIVVALVKGFTGLQNPDQTKFAMFLGLTKIRPLAFINAAHDLCLDGANQQNFDWIQYAIIEASKINHIWSEISNEIQYWLSVYSLLPELRMQSHLSRDSLEKVPAERENIEQAINEKIQILSKDERDVLNRLHREDGDINALTRLGLYMLAGKPLETFAESFVNWSFSTQLNSDYAVPRNDLIHLISLNRIDWQETRIALLEACNLLRSINTSITGKWALVTILRATGDTDDDEEARTIVTELCKDQPSFKSWRLIENFCANDPCNPASIEPDNISQTATQYAAMDVNNLRQGLGHTHEDLLFDDARTGMARFKPIEAFEKHYELAENILKRSEFPLRQGLFELHKHNVLLTSMQAHELIKRWRQIKTGETLNNLTKQDSWIVSQYFLLLAFPFLNPLEQTQTLLLVEEDENILLDLINVMSPLDEITFDRLFNEARKNKNEYKQYLLLIMAKSTNTPLSIVVRQYISSLVNARSEKLRSEALGFVATLRDKDMLSIIAKSSWSATHAQTETISEQWNGSKALLEAAVLDLIDHQDVLDRISPSLYGRAAVMLNIEAKREIVQRINISIEKTIEIAANLVAPDIELESQSTCLDWPNFLRISDKAKPDMDVLEAMQLYNETFVNFEERQKRNYDAFVNFKMTLTKAKASIILDDLEMKEFAAIVAVDKGIADKWYALFIDLTDSHLSVVHNLILLLAYALSIKEPDKAKALFKKCRDSKPIVKRTFGLVGIEFDAMIIWAAERNSTIDEQRIIRLDQAETDHHLSLEVIAALLNHQQDFLINYVKEKLKKIEPAEIARGIMVVGFSDTSKFNSNVLSRYENSSGLIGQAHKAAKYAYERNNWSRYWFEKMCQATIPHDFWCNSVLFNKITDGRFEIWGNDYPRTNTPIKVYGNSRVSLENRYKRWKELRKKTLFGKEAPARIFIMRTE